jgi:hypothetical protein
MMQEMYEWYMDNLFPEHRRQAIKHAEKDGRDRKKRLAQGPSPGTSMDPTLWVDYVPTTVNMTRMYVEMNRYRGRSKWERIGSPFVASTVDWAIIADPTGWVDPKRRRLKMLAIQRQYDRYEEYSN